MRAVVLITAILLATPATAEWTLKQGEGYANAYYAGGRYNVWISCRRGMPLRLSIDDSTMTGDQMDGVRSLMMWVTLPDGRTDRWPVDATQEGPSIGGDLVVSDLNLEFFRNGQSFRIDSPQTRTVFVEGDMKGTGAARLAFKERCGH